MCDLGSCRGHWQSSECATTVAANSDACLGIPVFDAAGAPPVAFYVCPSSRGRSVEAACARLGYAPAEPPAGPPADAAPVSGDGPTFTESLLTLHPSGGQTFQSTGGFAGTAVQLGVLAGATGAYRNRQALRNFKYGDTLHRISETMGLSKPKQGQSERARDNSLALQEDRAQRKVVYRGADQFSVDDHPAVHAQVEEVRENDRRNLEAWQTEQANRARAATSTEQNTGSRWHRLFGRA